MLDFNDTLPEENEIAIITGITKFITHPKKSITGIKKEVKFLTEGKKGIKDVSETDLKKLADETPTIKLTDNTDKEIIKKIDSTSVDGYSSKEIRNMEYENFKKLGEAGSSENIRILDGNLDDAYQAFKSRAVKIEKPIEVLIKAMQGL